jgi:hypothetical protein
VKIDQWRISLAVIAVLLSMLGIVVALHGIVTDNQAVFYVGAGVSCGALVVVVLLLETIRNRHG